MGSGADCRKPGAGETSCPGIDRSGGKPGGDPAHRQQSGDADRACGAALEREADARAAGRPVRFDPDVVGPLAETTPGEAESGRLHQGSAGTGGGDARASGRTPGAAARDWAAKAGARQFQGNPARALEFLKEEEKDSGIVVNRGADVKFWHLTFQEFLAARLLAKMDAAERHSLLFAEGRGWLPEWREVVLLLAGILHQDRAENVNALVAAALDDLYGSTLAKRMFHWVGAKPKLAEQARCFGLLGAMLRDLQPLGYTPPDRRYAEVKNAVLGIFEANQAAAIPFKTRLAVAEALGQAGDPRLRLPRGPGHLGRVGGGEHGEYPVTAQEYQLFVDDGGSKPERWDNQLLRPNCPVVNITWFDAKAYCDWARVRLPTEAEWERAARGPEGREYPWGNEEPDPERANYAEQHRRG